MVQGGFELCHGQVFHRGLLHREPINQFGLLQIVLKNTVYTMKNLLFTILLFISVCFAPARQSQPGGLTGNWVVRNINDTEGTVRSTYFNLKQEGGKITGTIRTTQFFYTIKDSTGGPDGFTLIAAMQDGRNERRIQYEGKLVGDELRIGRRARPDAPLTEMIAKRTAAGEGA